MWGTYLLQAQVRGGGCLFKKIQKYKENKFSIRIGTTLYFELIHIFELIHSIYPEQQNMHLLPKSFKM